MKPEQSKTGKIDRFVIDNAHFIVMILHKLRNLRIDTRGGTVNTGAPFKRIYI